MDVWMILLDRVEDLGAFRERYSNDHTLRFLVTSTHCRLDH